MTTTHCPCPCFCVSTVESADALCPSCNRHCGEYRLPFVPECACGCKNIVPVNLAFLMGDLRFWSEACRERFALNALADAYGDDYVEDAYQSDALYGPGMLLEEFIVGWGA